MDNHEVFAVIATLVVGFLFFFIYGLRKIYKGSKEEVKKTTVSTIYWILVPAAVFALSAIVVATYTFIKQPDYYKVLDIYNTGVGGSRAQDNVGRTQSAIDKYHPAYMLILYGINDIIHSHGVAPTIGAVNQMVLVCKQNNVVPVVATYPEVIRNNMEGVGAGSGVQFISPFLNLGNREYLPARLSEAFAEHGIDIPVEEMTAAMDAAWDEDADAIPGWLLELFEPGLPLHAPLL